MKKEKKRQKLVIMRGLQGSGKTTYAKTLCEKGYKRFGKDDLRMMIDNKRYDKKNEKFIDEVELSMVDLALRNGYDVVIDDTNVSEDRVMMILSLFGNMDYAENIDVNIKFMNTPLETCIERDAARGDLSVGKDVIMNFYNNGFKEIYEDKELINSYEEPRALSEEV